MHNNCILIRIEYLEIVFISPVGMWQLSGGAVGLLSEYSDFKFSDHQAAGPLTLNRHCYKFTFISFGSRATYIYQFYTTEQLRALSRGPAVSTWWYWKMNPDLPISSRNLNHCPTTYRYIRHKGVSKSFKIRQQMAAQGSLKTSVWMENINSALCSHNNK